MSDGQSNGSSSSSESGDSLRDPFAVATEDINISDASPPSSSDEVPTSSQYQAEKLRHDAAHEYEDDLPPEMINSDDEDDEEALPVQNSKHSLPKNQRSSSSDAVYSKFLKLGRQFVAELEDARKEQLIQRKSAKQVLDFDEMPPP